MDPVAVVSLEDVPIPDLPAASFFRALASVEALAPVDFFFAALGAAEALTLPPALPDAFSSVTAPDYHPSTLLGAGRAGRRLGGMSGLATEVGPCCAQ